MQGRMAEAAGYFDRAATLREDDFQAAGLAQTIYRDLGRLQDMTRAARRCIDAAKRAIAVNPGDSRALYMGALALHDLDENELSKEWADRAIEVDPDEVGTLYNIACLAAISGDGERALDLLERAVDLGWARAEWLRADPDFASVRDNPRYEALLKRLGA
jgi:adenylate cyclase